MMTYKFTKNGKSYSVKGINEFDAKITAEMMFHVDLDGAKLEEIWNLKTVRITTV